MHVRLSSATLKSQSFPLGRKNSVQGQVKLSLCKSCNFNKEIKRQTTAFVFSTENGLNQFCVIIRCFLVIHELLQNYAELTFTHITNLASYHKSRLRPSPSPLRRCLTDRHYRVCRQRRLFTHGLDTPYSQCCSLPHPQTPISRRPRITNHIHNHTRASNRRHLTVRNREAVFRSP